MSLPCAADIGAHLVAGVDVVAGDRLTARAAGIICRRYGPSTPTPRGRQPPRDRCTDARDARWPALVGHRDELIALWTSGSHLEDGAHSSPRPVVTSRAARPSTNPPGQHARVRVSAGI